jgi:hypothetical protein
MVVRGQELETGRIAGTVVSAATGQPVTAFRQWLVVVPGREVQQPERRRADPERGRHVRSDELTHGETYALAIATTNDDLAPALAGPIAVTQREHRFEVRLEEPGRASIRVLDPTGTPAQQAQVGIDQRERPVPRTRWLGPRRTDDLGVAAFDKLAPGRYEVTASRLGQHVTASCEVLAGRTTEVEVRLPR